MGATCALHLHDRAGNDGEGAAQEEWRRQRQRAWHLGCGDRGL